MDPVTVLAACTASYNAIKAGIAVGKEIQHMAKDLASLWDSVAKLTRMAAEPARYTNIGSSRESYEARAIELYAAKAKAHDMAAQVRGQFIASYGLEAWDQVQRAVAEMKRQAALAAAERKRKQDELIALVTAIVGMFLIGGISFAVIVGVLWLATR
jgi:inorganic triphosphatase YgiF